VGTKRGQLPVERVGDVDIVVRAWVPISHTSLTSHGSSPSSLKQLGVGERVTGIGKDRCIARGHARLSTVSDLRILKPLVLPKLAVLRRGRRRQTARPHRGRCG
jgi:hypothetical protein